MSDQFTESTTTGWGQRLVGSLVAVIFGLILVPVSIGLLYWNEGRAVEAIQALSRGASSIVEVNPDTVDPQTNGKLVHVTGMMQPTTPARDPVFSVTGDGLLRLSRSVEMYQWKQDSSSQSQQSLGGSKTTTTTYSYQKVWSDQPIQSSQFKVPDGHQNPPMPIQSAG
ncbi:MAG TPA: TMEM43 family protein, partial [Beijerinckiaceae bacterium]|nr:TMEM43 family protein [Beijerinckiaceae bacterium]